MHEPGRDLRKGRRRSDKGGRKRGAKSLFREACEAGDARGCLNLSRRLESSDKKQAAALRQKAQKLHEKECEAGLAKKCMEFKKSTVKEKI